MLEDVYKRVAERLGISPSDVEKIYKSFWYFVKDGIESLPLKDDITEAEFDSLRVSFNIPSLGKLYCDKDRYFKMKSNYNRIKNGNSSKED